MNKERLKGLNIFFSLLTAGSAWPYYLRPKRPILFGAFYVGILGVTITQERLNAHE